MGPHGPKCGPTLQIVRIRYSEAMRKILLTSVMCILTLPAFGQGSTITVIHDDGSKDVIDLGEDAISQHAPEKTPPAIDVIHAEPNVEEPAPSKPVAVQAVPESAPAVKQPAPKPKLAAKQAKAAVIQTPSKKPHRQVLQAGEAITRDKALYIALSEAPPSRDVEIQEMLSPKGTPMYAVLFKDEAGVYEVLVDGISGVILSSGKLSKANEKHVQPGHLPMR